MKRTDNSDIFYWHSENIIWNNHFLYYDITVSDLWSSLQEAVNGRLNSPVYEIKGSLVMLL